MFEHGWSERSLSALATCDCHCVCEPLAPLDFPSPISRNPRLPMALAPLPRVTQLASLRRTVLLYAPDPTHLLIQATLFSVQPLQLIS